MNKIILALAGISLILSACSPSSKQLKEAIEKDPSIVFSAIEKDPEAFFKVVMKAQRDAQEKAASQQSQDETVKREEEFKNPLQPQIEEARAINGPKDAKITIVEYSDFECPFCRRGHENVKKVMEMFPGKVRVVFKHLPLDFHPKAMPAARYFEAIARQSAEKAYKWHDMIFENQSALKDKGEAYFETSAKKLGLDIAKIKKDLQDADLMKRITADMEEAKKFGFTGTPGYLINGVSLRGAYPPEEFKSIIDRHLGSAKN